MHTKKISFTKEGYQKMTKDYQELTEKRKDAVIRLRTAREMGDLSENGAYKAARFELTAIDRESRRLSYLLQMGEIVEPKNNSTVEFGSKITVTNDKGQMTFTLVSGYESDPTHMRYSVYSPIGKAVLGKKKGEKVVVYAPAGQIIYKIVSID